MKKIRVFVFTFIFCSSLLAQPVYAMPKGRTMAAAIIGAFLTFAGGPGSGVWYYCENTKDGVQYYEEHSRCMPCSSNTYRSSSSYNRNRINICIDTGPTEGDEVWNRCKDEGGNPEVFFTDLVTEENLALSAYERGDCVAGEAYTETIDCKTAALKSSINKGNDPEVYAEVDERFIQLSEKRQAFLNSGNASTVACGQDLTDFYNDAMTRYPEIEKYAGLSDTGAAIGVGFAVGGTLAIATIITAVALEKSSGGEFGFSRQRNAGGSSWGGLRVRTPSLGGGNWGNL